jgi:cytoskeleton protein RodZ
LAPSPAAASAVPVPNSALTEGRASLQLRTREASWIEVTDANSQVLLARVVAAGEDLALDAAPPVRVKIGNARATELLLRGQPVDLTAQTRDNVARMELK